MDIGTRYLSMRQAGKGVILQLATEELNIKIEVIMQKEHNARTEVRTPQSVVRTPRSVVGTPRSAVR